jgi:hypothetical protein
MRTVMAVRLWADLGTNGRTKSHRRFVEAPHDRLAIQARVFRRGLVAKRPFRLSLSWRIDVPYSPQAPVPFTLPRSPSPMRASLCICHNADCTSTRDDKAAKPPAMREKTDAPEIAISMHLS